MAETLPPVAEIGRAVEYCPFVTCTLPFEYCEFGPHPEKCDTWLRKNRPAVHAELKAGAAEGEAKSGGKKKKKKAKKTKREKRLGDKRVKIYQLSRGGRKFVTSIAGLDAFGLDLKESGKKLSRRFACGASVVKMPPPAPFEIHIQGITKEVVAKFISQKLKVPSEKIYFTDPKGKKLSRAF